MMFGAGEATGSLGGRIDPRVFGAARPIRSKVSLHVDRIDADTVDVRLSVPLDETIPDERAAEPVAEDGRLDVHYVVDMDLRAERDALTARLTAMYRTEEGRRLAASEELTPAQMRRIFAPIALQGWSVLDRLLLSPEPRGYPHHIDVVRCAVQSALARSQTIDVTSSEPLFPWALLFDGRGFNPTDLSTLNLERFWGFQHEIQERAEGTSPLSRLPERPQIVKSICSHVDAKRRHADPMHPLARYDNTVDVGTVDELGRMLSSFEGDCLYFFGHAGRDGNPPVPSESWIQLRGVSLTVAALQSVYRAPMFQHELVVVFLNGCSTSPLGAWNTGSFIGHLCRQGRGRVCCLATVAEVPEGFAAQFARHFWEAFIFERRPIGQAVLEARRMMLRNPPHSPLGLVYTLLGRVDTRFSGRPA